MDSNHTNYFTNLLNSPVNDTSSPNTTNRQVQPNFLPYSFPPLYAHTQDSSHGMSNVSRFLFPPNTQYSMFTPNPYMPTFPSQPTPNAPNDFSEIPPFSTQESVENKELDENNHSKALNKEKWSHKEDELMISAWLVISTDSVVGTNQQSKDFWKRIVEYYNTHRASFIERKTNVLKSHYYRINPQVNDFNQGFIRLKNEHHSGWSDDQVMEKAREVYYSVHKSQFKYEHVWRMVKDEPKWRGGSSINLSGKRAKTSASGTYTSSTDIHASINTNDVEVEVRPIGTKTAKRKGKEKSHAPDRVGKVNLQ